MNKIQILYRLSDKGNPKRKLLNATKEGCLDNAVKCFPNSNIIVFADNCEEETLDMINSKGLTCVETCLGNSGSFRHILDYAIANFEDNTIVYLLEDDYLHRNGAEKLLLEGISVGDYVTLYDHPDKYTSFHGSINPLIADEGERTIISLTHSSHWKFTNSTTMTFCTKVKTLKEDRRIWFLFTKKKIPQDYAAFCSLIGNGKLTYKILGFGKSRKLVCPIPSFSTHAEIDYLAPLINWESI